MDHTRTLAMRAMYRVIVPAFGLVLVLASSWCEDLLLLPESALDPSLKYYLSRVCAVVLLLCLVCSRRFRLLLVRKASLSPILGFCLAACFFAHYVADSLPASVFVAQAGYALYRMAESLLVVLWLATCSAMKLDVEGDKADEINVVYPLAFAFVACIYFVLASLSSMVVLAVLSAGLLLSGVLLYVSMRHLGFANEPADIRSSDYCLKPHLKRLVIFYGLFMIAMFFAITINANIALGSLIGMLVLSLLALVAASFLSGRHYLKTLFGVIGPCFVAGMLLFAWIQQGFELGTICTSVAHVAFDLYIYQTVVCELLSQDAQGKERALWLFALVVLVGDCGMLGGHLAGSLFVARPLVDMGTTNVILAVLIVIVSLIWSFLPQSRYFAPAEAAKDDEIVLELPATGAFETPYGELSLVCGVVGRKYELTIRETEVLELLMRGMSSARIEEELCISGSTVKTHIRHIYEKFGVHTRDEMSRVVEKVRIQRT